MDNFDKRIKNRVNDEIKHIPEDLDKKIEKLLNDKKKNNRWKRTAAVAAIGFIVFSGFGVTFTSYATGRDFKDIVYSILGFNDNYNKYATGLNEAQSSEGMKVTITSVVFDGYKVNIAYKLEAEDDKQHLIDTKGFNLQTNNLGETKIKINNKNVKTPTEEHWDLDEEGNQIGVLSYGVEGGVVEEEGWLDRILSTNANLSNELINNWISKEFIGESAKDFNIEIDINKYIDGKEANWKFNIPISNEKLRADIKEYKVDKTEDGVNVESIVVTPLSIYVKGNVSKEYEELNVILENDKGKNYDFRTGSIGGTIGEYKFKYEFDNRIKDSKDIKIKVIYNNKELKNLETKLNVE